MQPAACCALVLWGSWRIFVASTSSLRTGNVLAVMSRRGHAHVVLVKHEPFDRNEIMHIHAAEGWVSPKGLVNDEADVSQLFGWDVNETAMRTAVTMHHQLVRRHVHICGGYEVKMEGDAFMGAFTTVLAALLWCINVQNCRCFCWTSRG
jgi:hypothetical protein